MLPNILSRKAYRTCSVLVCIGLSFLLLVSGCGGGGGGGGTPLPAPDVSVTISGTADDGTANSPIANAVCVFKDSDGNLSTGITADATGRFTFTVLPDKEGFLYCRPRNISRLNLFTFLSTTGLAAGDEIANEDVNPATTVAASVILSEGSADPLNRKNQLLADIEAGRDADLSLLVSLTTEAFKRIVEHDIDVNFGGDDQGGGEGGAGGGGVGGGAGDGGDASPIGNASCEFIVVGDLSNGKVLHNAALDDLLDDGHISRSDLTAIRDEMSAAVAGRETELTAAYTRFFGTGGIGTPLAVTADSSGEYFIETPPDVPGFVRCYPPGNDQLILATYISGRTAGADLLGQDLDPSTTLFSNNVAAELMDVVDTSLLSQIKDNYLEDTRDLGLVHIVKEGDEIKGFQIQDPASQIDNDASMVAFTATSLYLSYIKNGINRDYIGVLNEVAAAEEVTQNNTGLSGARLTVLNESVTTAANDLSTGFGHALKTARIKVTVTDSSDGSAIDAADAMIVDPNSLGAVPLLPLANSCDVDGVFGSDCVDATDSSGQVVFFLNPAPTTLTDYTVQVSKEGYITKQVVTQAFRLAKLSPSVALQRSVAPTLTNAAYSLVILNDCTESDGGLPHSTFNLSFDYNDINGDANQAAGAVLGVDYQFVGGRNFQEDQSAALTGTEGFSGSIQFEKCIRFDNTSELDVTFSLTDGDGNPSDALLLNIARPTGAN